MHFKHLSTQTLKNYSLYKLMNILLTLSYKYTNSHNFSIIDTQRSYYFYIKKFKRSFCISSRFLLKLYIQIFFRLKYYCHNRNNRFGTMIYVRTEFQDERLVALENFFHLSPPGTGTLMEYDFEFVLLMLRGQITDFSLSAQRENLDRFNIG